MDKCIQLQRRVSKFWGQMGDSDQFAAEYAMQHISNDSESLAIADATDDELWDAAVYGCDTINYANAESDYEGEDFYQDEADTNIVFRYLKLKRDLAKCKRGDITASTEITASKEVDNMEDILLGYIGSEVLLQELVKSLDTATKRELFEYIADMYDIPLS